MGSFRIIILFAALLHGSAAFASDDPCELADDVDVARVLGGPIVPVPVDEIGEETAPYCLWATRGQRARIKLMIWSEAELPVLNMPDAETYFMTLETEARGEPGFGPIDGFGARAFVTDGAVVMLKAGRVVVFDFEGVSPSARQTFVTAVAPRL